MIFRNARLEDLKLMCELWNEVVTEEYFLKTMSVDAYEEKLLNNPDFSYDSTFVVYDEENTIIAFAIGYLRKQYIDNLEVAGIVNALASRRTQKRLRQREAWTSRITAKYKPARLTISPTVFSLAITAIKH